MDEVLVRKLLVFLPKIAGDRMKTHRGNKFTFSHVPFLFVTIKQKKRLHFLKSEASLYKHPFTEYRFSSILPRPHEAEQQAVRSLVLLCCTCYQASTCSLSTRWSSWDLDLAMRDGKTGLGSGFTLRCFQRFSFLDIALQPWGWHPNWHTSGRAISVLSYWR